MANLKLFREQVDFYLFQAGIESKERNVDERRGMTQAELADACGLNRAELNRKLNGKSPISSILVKNIVIALAKRYGITTKSQAKELLTLMNVPDFSPADWNALPLNLLEEDTSVNDSRISVNDTGIPRLFDHFCGRDDLFKKLKDQLCGSKITRSIALYGKPGVGKTAIAMAIANDPRVQQYFHGGILWAGLGTNPDIESIQRRWRNLLHIQDIEAETMQMVIGSQPVLLVLDDVCNINHVAFFFQLGNYNPSCRYLITTISQSLADKISENHSFEIPELTAEQGLELLLHLAPNIVPAEKEEANTLIEVVGGLPLAIWLMGMHLESEANRNQPRRIQDALTLLQDYEERLQLERLSSDLKEFPSLKGSAISLETVIGVRYEALDVNSQQMLRALSIFPPKPNTFSEDAASAVAATSGKTFRDHLVDAGLVEDVGGDRYTLHQTIRDFALWKLSKKQGEEQAANERLAHFFAEYVKTREVQSFDEANIAQKWSQMEILKDHFERAIEIDRDRAVNNRRGEGVDFFSLGNIALIQKKYEEAASNYQKCLDIVDEFQEKVKEGMAPARWRETILLSRGTVLSQLCETSLFLGNVDIAKDYRKQSMQITQELQHRRHYAGHLLYYGHLSLANEQKEEASRYYQKALEAAQEVQDQAIVAEAHYYLGKLAELDGDLDQAEGFHRKSLELSEAIQSAPLVAKSHLRLGYLLLKRDKNQEEGCSMISKAIQWYTDMGLKEDEITQEIAK